MAPRVISGGPLSSRPTLERATPTSHETYTLKWGDTAWSVARRFNVSLEALATLNELADPNRVQAGQVLRIPVGAPWNAAEAAGWLHGARSVALPPVAMPVVARPVVGQPVVQPEPVAAKPAVPQLPAATQPLSPSSRQSLDKLLGDVWQRREHIASQQDVYALYNAAPKVEALSGDLTVATARYFDELKSLADGRAADARSTIQGFTIDGAGKNETSGILSLLAEGKVTPEGEAVLKTSFFRFERPADEGEITERVYVNARPDHAMEVMNFVVREVLDRPAEFPGVNLAKVAGPQTVGRRTDNIVVYTTDSAAADRVVAALQRYSNAHPGHLGTAVPLSTQPIINGVARGAEPDAAVNPDGRVSFGSLRSRCIFDALTQTRGGTYEQFTARVAQLLEASHVDPLHPDRNLVSGGTP